MKSSIVPSSVQMSSSSYISSSPSQLFSQMSDEEEEEEEEAQAGTTDAPGESQGEISGVKEGIMFPTSLNGTDVRVGIIMGRWNSDIIAGLYKGINESLTTCGVKKENIFATYVPGAFELPLTAKFLAASKRVDVIICVGCLIKGDTMHFEYIADATAKGIMQVGIDSMVPCIFGVLTVMNKEQAIVRSAGETNEGLSWGKSAVEMGLARMSALGMFKPAEGTEEPKGQSFSNFNATMPKVGAVDDKNSTKVAKKSFGF
eukprot:CAMPEP_0119033352 /NCGR_PEP_ID=MMETSP1177-20130426/400_1 /TAXON_ID=2985 /ORGANISM="Ochromonas sp, Strain CCMP1899" /LENGTH=258 /DNA_ID=CAMNT_0006990035 /DNA_START=228 /DNA_END=1004 /DNA_ORIENTATION=+